MTDRRNFLRSMIGGVAATAAVRTWPFRVYSFPSEIVSVYPGLDENFPEGRMDLLSLENWGKWPESVREQLPYLKNGILYVRDDDPRWIGLIRSPFRVPLRFRYVANPKTTR